MTRKTIDVETVRNSINTALNNWQTQNENMGDERAYGYRIGLAAALEAVLMDTGNYRGFHFNDPRKQYTDTGLMAGSYDDSIRWYF